MMLDLFVEPRRWSRALAYSYHRRTRTRRHLNDHSTAIQDFAAHYDSLSVQLGDGSGKLGAATSYPIGGAISALVSGDFNGDAKIDLAASNKISDHVSVLLGDGTGRFGSAVDYPVGWHAKPLVVGDFNGDKQLDLAVGNQAGRSVSVLFGDGLGGFRVAPEISTHWLAHYLAVGDFDNDGLTDLVLVDNGYVSMMLSRLR